MWLAPTCTTYREIKHDDDVTQYIHDLENERYRRSYLSSQENGQTSGETTQENVYLHQNQTFL